MKITSKKIETPLGPMILGSTDQGLCLCEFDGGKTKPSKFFELEEGLSKYIKVAEKQINEYFNNERENFDLPIDLVGTEFQKDVWNKLSQIPYGSTSTYLDQAKALGNVKAIRAMASANGQNKIAIIIPCHRVIGSNGSLTGYAGGIEKKKWLLDFESNQLPLF